MSSHITLWVLIHQNKGPDVQITESVVVFNIIYPNLPRTNRPAFLHAEFAKSPCPLQIAQVKQLLCFHSSFALQIFIQLIKQRHFSKTGMKKAGRRKRLGRPVHTTHRWQLRHSLSTMLQAQNARESQVSLTIPTKALVPGILVSLYLEQWLPCTRLVRSP